MTKDEARKEKQYLELLLDIIRENKELQDNDYIDSILDRISELDEIINNPSK